MVTGSCLCGQFKIEFDGQPAAKVSSPTITNKL